MVEYTANFVTANTDAPDFTRMDQLDRAADIWFSNIMALIKLRKEGVTKVSMLPKPVFRYMLDF